MNGNSDIGGIKCPHCESDQTHTADQWEMVASADISDDNLNFTGFYECDDCEGKFEVEIWARLHCNVNKDVGQ